MISTSTHLAQSFAQKNRFSHNSKSNSILPCHHQQPQKTEIPIGHNAELRLWWVEDVQRNGLSAVVRRSSSFWGGRVVEGDGCQKIRRFYHEIHECTIFGWLQIHATIHVLFVGTTYPKYTPCTCGRLLRFFCSKKKQVVGGIELVTDSSRVPHQARKVEMIPFGS